jgi:hypothetical protein
MYIFFITLFCSHCRTESIKIITTTYLLVLLSDKIYYRIEIYVLFLYFLFCLRLRWDQQLTLQIKQQYNDWFHG